ncbi:MAG: GAF domain-containing protein [Deltaproteobacteria bacterium]|nr:GAF domain-containing protein [Deltaproteobacteria bacterium]MBW2152883.1 GAF domain-containing protein [Deltaproteobacteria bacterium]
MKRNDKILETLRSITVTSNNSRLDFKDKLQRILYDIVSCMNSQKGSIMIVKGRKTLEVVASTNPSIIGIKQPIDSDTPSAWVVKNKKMLLAGKVSDSSEFTKRFDHYKKEAFLLAPILRENKVIGIISVTEKMGQDRFSRVDQEILLIIASHVISALDNHRLAESLRKSRQSLKQKNKKLKELEMLEKVRTDLFNMLVHDLKGPISEVLANIDILSYTVEGENQDYVESARSGCDTLYQMVADLLDIAKMEEGSLQLCQEKIVPADLIQEAVSRLHGLSKSRDVHLIENIPSSGNNITLKGDRGILLRVLQNLLTNAIQFSPSGDTIITGFSPIDPDKIQFYVQDNGPGIPVEYQEAIFDKFMQIRARREGRKYTTGLGLTFCKMAVDSHNGSIYVKSDGVKGSRFEFILPR